MKTLGATAFLTCLLSGCIAAGPNYEAKNPRVPSHFASLAAPAIIGDPVPENIIDKWWKVFDDSTLDNYMERAVRQNLDLRMATARLHQARAQAVVASSSLLPEGGLAAEYERSRSPQSADPPTGTSRYKHLYLASFDASWEIDIFGGVRREIEASQAALEASREGLRDTLVTLRGEVARNYLDARGTQLRLKIAKDEVRVRRENADIIGARARAGLVSELDWARARGELASAEANIPYFERSLKAAVHRLEVLLGQEPGSLEEDFRAFSELPQIPDELPVGLPSDLLRRRPDIRRAERELAAATARIGVSTAELFPRFSLVGSFGYQTGQSAQMFWNRSNFWSIGPTMIWPILNFRRIMGQIEATKAVHDEVLAGYEKSVLLALEETENALVALSREKQRVIALAEAVRANELAVKFAMERYVSGLQSYLAVIDAQRALYSAEDQLALSRQNQATAFVALYKALGGGWE